MDIQEFTYVDIILAIPLLFGLIRGFLKGLIIEIASLFAIVLGYFCAIHLAHFMNRLLILKLGFDYVWLPYVSVIFVFLLIVILVMLSAKLLEGVINLMQLGIINKLLGAFFGLLKYWIITSIVLFYLNQGSENRHFFDPVKSDSSKLYPYVNKSGIWLSETFTPKAGNV